LHGFSCNTIDNAPPHQQRRDARVSDILPVVALDHDPLSRIRLRHVYNEKRKPEPADSFARNPNRGLTLAFIKMLLGS
jgi:hypothetical protein